MGSTVETTPPNVTAVGVVFLSVAILCLTIVIVVATVPGFQLPFG